MELAREEAILAQQRQVNDNKSLVIKMKIEEGKREKEREANAAEVFEKKQGLMAEVQSGKDKARVNVQEK